MTMTAPPYSLFLDLGAVSDHGLERTLTPNGEERQAIARWLGVEAVESFTAIVRMKRRGEDNYLYEARFDVDVVQACVVTLAPVPAHLTGEFHRDVRVRPQTNTKKRRQAEDARVSVEATGLNDDESDWLDEPQIDLVAPLLEELTLALDPYPRAPEAEFQIPGEEAEPRESPFAVLEKFKAGEPSASKKPPNGGKRK
jgi:uncharacterized metal-binding protein YceD (DUF177 family)